MQISRDEVQTSTTQIEIGSATDVGRVRKKNEDSYRVVPELRLFVLSDGIGGQANGEVASAMAVETIVSQSLKLSASRSTSHGDAAQPESSNRTSDLVKAAHAANRTIYGASVSDPRLRGMGSTLVAAWMDSFRLSLVHVGDSRAYLLREGNLARLTSDHTLVAEQVRSGILTAEQAQVNPLRRVLIRALGVSEEVEFDIHEHELHCNDVLLLCTDGLTGMVSESEIRAVLLREHDAQSAADSLLACANAHGGDDNITVITVQIGSSTRGILSL